MTKNASQESLKLDLKGQLQKIKKEDMTIDEYDQWLVFENEEHPMAEHNASIVRNLERFIKRNKQLLHLDLTQTNLTEFMLWKIGTALSRAKSLVALHLSGNQGITSTLT